MLPIYAIKSELIKAITDGNQLILSASTGSGKSTQLPQILHNENPDLRILVLQPRRIAARMLAKRVAEELRVTLGDEVGFITRDEKKLSSATRICFVTAGILPRMLQSNSELNDWDCVIFDEFHERPMVGDIGLGMIKQLQEKSRKELKLIVMSATLELDLLQSYLPNASVLKSGTRLFPVDVTYFPDKPESPIWERARKAMVAHLNSHEEGDILVFMPGAFEIRKTIEEFKKIKVSLKINYLPLHGNLPVSEQNRVMEKMDGIKVIVATNIAETSLTIPGVRHVIDSGIARINRFDPARGIDVLNIEHISQQSTAQRKGRAGREAEGTCIRLWSENRQSMRPTHTEAEIARIDFSEALLAIKSLGYKDSDSFPWIEAPTEAAKSKAIELLTLLDIVETKTQALTSIGLKAARIPLHPRLSRLVVEASKRQCTGNALLAAALLSERPILMNGKNNLRQLASQFDTSGKNQVRKRRQNPVSQFNSQEQDVESDLLPLIQAMHFLAHSRFDLNTCRQMNINGNTARQVWRAYTHLCRVCRLQYTQEEGTAEGLVKSLLTAFPDQISVRRDNSSAVCFMRHRKRGEVNMDTLVRSPLFIAADIREINHGKTASGTMKLSMNSEVRKEWLNELFPEAWERIEELFWNEAKMRVEKRFLEKCLDVILEEKLVRDQDFKEKSGAILARQILKKSLKLKGWNKDVESWISRVRWCAAFFPEKELISYDGTDIECIIEEFCEGEHSYDSVKNKPLIAFVENVMSWEDQQFIKKMAPGKIQLPNGKKMRLNYVPGQRPKGINRIQELFGLEETPVVAGGREKVLIEILAPNMRAVQITDDLKGFWTTLYPQLKKQLSRRYPKHEWR